MDDDDLSLWIEAFGAHRLAVVCGLAATAALTLGCGAALGWW
jgi:hypothetical protein